VIKLKDAFLIFKNAFKKNLETNKTFKSQIPNILTFSRALAPITVTPLVLTGNLIPGLVVGALLASTDFFDGKLARKWHVESEFGTLLDQIVDKIFAITLLLTGASLNPIILANLVPEIAISLTNAKAFINNKNTNSSLIGKIKTWLLSINILLSFIPNLKMIYKIISVSLTFTLQTATFFNYTKKNKTQKINQKITTLEPIIEEEKTEEKVLSKAQKMRNQKIELLKYEKELLLEQNKKCKQKILKKDK